MNTGANQNLRLLALLAAPIVLVQGARMMLGGGPARSSAAIVEAAPTITLPEPFEPPALTDQDRTIAEWIAAQPAIERSPMGGRAPAAAPARAPRVTAVIGRGASAMASIDGALYRIGDELEPGWTVRRIDGMRVELVNAQGATRTIGE